MSHMDKVLKAHAEANRQMIRTMGTYRPPARTRRQMWMDDIGTALAWVVGVLLVLALLAVAAYAIRYGWEAGA